MTLRHALPIALAAAMFAVTGAAAETRSAYSINDHTTDPMMAAIRSVLADAGTTGEFLDKRDAAAVAEYYASRGYEPVWTADGALSERGRAVAARLRAADTDGLDPRAYPTPTDGGYVNTRSVAAADVLLSRSIVTYARHAYGGLLKPSSISKNLDYKPNVIDPFEVMSAMALADDPAVQLASYNPQRPEFQKLRDELAAERASNRARPPFIDPDGGSLKLGSTGDRVALLRQRLKVTTEAEDPKVFDEGLDEAVRAYQESAGLTVDGIVGRGTLGKLNAAAQDHVSTILVNMERWRWMPKELGNYYVRVNVPNFNLEIYKDEKVAYTTRIVVGKPQNQTPIFSDEIEHVIVNPTWHVPASITRNELLPAVRQNRGALRGYQVFANINGRFRQVDPTFVNWGMVDASKIQIKQPPGAGNALGRVKFMFPNSHSVYLHDTPAKSLFQRDYRAYSHGCMRVYQPLEFGDALLSHDPQLSGEAVRKRIGGAEQQLNLKSHIPVHITYFTAWIDDAGELQIRGDVYGHDARMKKALGLS